MASDQADIHIPVLLAECLHYLTPQRGGLYVDGTLGLGGHTGAILAASGPDGRVVAFEWDEAAIAHSQARHASYGERLLIVRRNFAELQDGLAEVGVDKIDGLLIDIGLSSLQLDLGERGFSFQRDEELDMRMDNRRPVSASSILATATEQELADIIYYYGEERQARPIAAAIVERRRKQEITRSRQLVDVVVKAVPKRFHPKKIHVATKTFQALRIAVNTELENLAAILDSGPEFLRKGARFCVISFHSLEDRIVKTRFKADERLAVLTTRPVTASDQEVMMNPRARSARLRVAEKK